MNAAAANAVITPASDLPSTPSFPELVPLSPKEMKKLKRDAVLVRIAWAMACVFLLQLGIRTWYEKIQGITYATMTSEERSLFICSIIGTVLLYLLYIFFARYHILQDNKNIKNATKQVGMIKVISRKYVYRRDTSDGYYVSFNWVADPKREVILLDEYEMYDKLREGDIAYVELLPHTQSVLAVSHRTRPVSDGGERQ